MFFFRRRSISQEDEYGSHSRAASGGIGAVPPARGEDDPTFTPEKKFMTQNPENYKQAFVDNDPEKIQPQTTPPIVPPPVPPPEPPAAAPSTASPPIPPTAPPHIPSPKPLGTSSPDDVANAFKALSAASAASVLASAGQMSSNIPPSESLLSDAEASAPSDAPPPGVSTPLPMASAAAIQEEAKIIANEPKATFSSFVSLPPPDVHTSEGNLVVKARPVSSDTKAEDATTSGDELSATPTTAGEGSTSAVAPNMLPPPNIHSQLVAAIVKPTEPSPAVSYNPPFSSPLVSASHSSDTSRPVTAPSPPLVPTDTLRHDISEPAQVDGPNSELAVQLQVQNAMIEEKKAQIAEKTDQITRKDEQIEEFNTRVRTLIAEKNEEIEDLNDQVRTLIATNQVKNKHAQEENAKHIADIERLKALVEEGTTENDAERERREEEVVGLYTALQAASKKNDDLKEQMDRMKLENASLQADTSQSSDAAEDTKFVEDHTTHILGYQPQAVFDSLLDQFLKE